MNDYFSLLCRVAASEKRWTRSGEARAAFAEQLTVDLSITGDTGDRMIVPVFGPRALEHIQRQVHKFRWFLRGQTDVHVPNAEKYHDTEYKPSGPLMGFSWRHATKEQEYVDDETNYDSVGGVDQLVQCERLLRHDPFSRDALMCAHHYLPRTSVPPSCTTTWSFFVSVDNKLSLGVSVRSSDVYDCLPHNVVHNCLLLYAMAKRTNRLPGIVIVNLSDAHVMDKDMGEIRTILDDPALQTTTLMELSFDHTIDWSEHTATSLNLTPLQP